MSHAQSKRQSDARTATIVRTSLLGIIANAALAAFKAAVGLLANSIAITLDAVNNLSDALSSAITIAGAKLAGRTPDRDHPYGHGRIEYLSALVIAALVLGAGVSSLVESVRRILEPVEPDHNMVGIAIVAVAVLVKVALGIHFRRVGRDVESDSLVASGTDALLDAVISAATVVGALVFVATGMNLEGWLGAAISLVILKAGYDIMRDTLIKILGKRVDPELAVRVKDVVRSVDGVHGAYDLMLNDYGPKRLWGSVHVEVDDSASALDIDRITRTVQHRVFDECGVVITAVGIYPANAAGTRASAMRERVEQMCKVHPEVLETHGFYVDEEARHVNFDVIISFDARDREQLFQQICETVRQAYPDYTFDIVLDADMTD